MVHWDTRLQLFFVSIWEWLAGARGGALRFSTGMGRQANIAYFQQSWAFPASSAGSEGIPAARYLASGGLKRSSTSTWYPATNRLVSLAIPTTDISSLNWASVIPLLFAEAVCEAMQYSH